MLRLEGVREFRAAMFEPGGGVNHASFTAGGLDAEIYTSGIKDSCDIERAVKKRRKE